MRQVNSEKLKHAHRPGEVAVELLNDGRETSAGHVEKLPAASHGLSVPSRGRMLLQRGNVAFLLMVEPELHESLEFDGVENEQGEKGEDAHDEEKKERVQGRPIYFF
jgi:hypothetical protein